MVNYCLWCDASGKYYSSSSEGVKEIECSQCDGNGYVPELCHCGRPWFFHPGIEGSDPRGFTRGLCAGCDAVRCDAYPADCPYIILR